MIRTYIICSTVLDIFLLLGAVLIPIYITPGYYYWTAILIFMFLSAGNSFSKRIDKWEQHDTD